MSRWIALPLLALALGCGSDKSADSGSPTGAATGTGTGAATGTGTGAATGTGTGAATGSATFDLTLNGTGYNPHDGQTLWFAIVDDNDPTGANANRATGATDGAGGIAETWPDVLVEGHSYTVYFGADFDSSGDCTPPPADHAWSKALPAVTGDVVLNETHNANFDADACDFL